MPDLFDNFFNKIGSKFNGGKTVHHYGGASQVNTGSYYSYHNTPTNNKYWLPRETSTVQMAGGFDEEDFEKPRKQSLSGIAGYMAKSESSDPRLRKSSVSSEMDE